jgi:pimeloyl-ACP methyl ester carboxylesterase
MTLLLVVVAVTVLALLALAAWSTRVSRRVQAALPPVGQWIEVDGERLHYTDRGDGPAIVMVHGLAGQLANFDYLPLDALAQRWRVIRVDRPGSGHSSRADGRDAAIDAQARTLIAFMQALGLQRPLLVGHSLGGAIALSVALQAPEAVCALALIAPLTHTQTEVPPPFRGLVIRSPALRRFVARTLALPLALLTRGPTLRYIFAPDPVPTDFALRGGGLTSLLPKNFYAASTDLCAIEHSLPQQEPHYPALRVPVQVIYGRGDKLLDWRAQGDALCTRVPNAELTLINGGHMIPVTAPQRVAAWLEQIAERWLGERASAAAPGALARSA